MKDRFIRFLKTLNCYEEYVQRHKKQWKKTKYAEIDTFLDHAEPITYINSAFPWDNKGYWDGLDKKWMKVVGTKTGRVFK